MTSYDLRSVKLRAVGQWPDIITRVAGISPEYFGGGHGPCPRCGGTKPWRVFRDFAETGGAICNHCGRFGDGLAVVAWALGVDFPEALAAVASHLGVPPSESRSKSRGKSRARDPESRAHDAKSKPVGKKADPERNPEEHLEFLPWNDRLAAVWCMRNRPIKPASLVAAGARMARYRSRHVVIALPIRDARRRTVGWSLYEVAGGKLPTFAGKRVSGQVKNKIAAGSSAGWMGPEEARGTVVAWKVEGPKDMLALMSLPLPPGHVVCSNAFGAGETPRAELIERFVGQRVYVVHDCDQPGQQGALEVGQNGRVRPGWAPEIAAVADQCRNVVLPYPITESGGKDLRDWIAEQLAGGLSGEETYAKLLEMAERSDVIHPPGSTRTPAEAGVQPGNEASSNSSPDDSGDAARVELPEAVDDPHRLARINLRNYHDRHGGTLRYWRDEWWRYKDGRYSQIELKELVAKVTASIKDEFDRDFKEREARGEDVEDVRRVKQSLLRDVVGAMASLCLLPGSISQPCWLEDRSSPHWIAMRNGILDLEAVFAGATAAECLRPHDSRWFSPFRLDYDFDADADCPRWLHYLNIAMEGDQERIRMLQEWAGYLLTPENDLQRFICFEGEGGNGKTVFFAAMEAMLGPENVSHVSLENFGDRFSLYSTLGKALNIAADVGELDQVAEGHLKMFTGGDSMFFDRKNKTPVSARPSAKLMCSWNNRPHLRDRSNGVWRRLMLVPFRHQVPRQDRVAGMDQSQWWVRNGEASGILNWAIVGLARLKAQGDFTMATIAMQALDDYRRESNPAAEFLEENIEFVESEYEHVESARLYELYKHWCNRSGFQPLGNRNFFKEVVRSFPGAVKIRLRHDGNRSWAYRHLKFSVDEIFSEPIEKKLW